MALDTGIPGMTTQGLLCITGLTCLGVLFIASFLLSMIAIEVDDMLILPRLRALRQLVGNLRPALVEIGEDLIDSTEQRFSSSTAPDGSAWALNSILSTLL